MFSSPAKRRKTSHPPPEPAQEGVDRSDVRQTPTRASFLSPTKASLARFNPNLLPKSTPTRSGASRPGSQGRPSSRGQQLRAYVLGDAEVLEAGLVAVMRTPNDAPVAPRPGSQARGDSVQKNINAQIARELEIVARQSFLAYEKIVGSETPAEEEEADLPLTPSQRGIHDVGDHTPREILYSSPSKRAKRSKALAKKLNSSPSKPRDQTHRGDETEEQAWPEVAAPQPEAEILDGEQTTATRTGEDQQVPGAASQESEAKQQEKDRLLQEMKALEDQVKRLEHAVHTLDTGPSNSDFENPQDLDSRIALINETNATLKPSDSPKRPPLSQLLTSFLPFSKPLAYRTEPAPPTPDAPTPSHAPLALDDPLPYLTLFTPFTITSSISTTPAPQSPTLHHTLTLTSPSSLLHATLHLHISPDPEPCITSLDLATLSPWAEPELGPWLRRCAAENDVGDVGWALGSYWELAIRRVECWGRCEKAWPELLGRGGKVGKGKGKAGGQANAELERLDVRSDGEEGLEEVSGVGDIIAGPGDGTGGKGKRAASRRELRRHLGRTELVFQSAEVKLRIVWRIQFDWTGEAESVVRAQAAFPPAWHEADERRSLHKVPATFERLVRERGVFEAVRVVVGLLFT
ncbi:hypothetical protein H2199_000378 [Coniosporium tulheliwenetii]|uniref:Uncharacterized protein n=1 Tax=Coniosporium tulheliwenetii TaxID=3383036 RepID=A0ACC2ZPU7_9PEZI|nr:hypothetical protein H2199_000378 [Cladosporium sp. JES 115]